MRLLAQGDDGGLSGAALEVLAILIAALIAAFAFALTVSRSLQSQIQRLLKAAQQMAQGDFGVEVPTEGSDEFAALGIQFNEMARQLERRLEELQLERKRLREAIQRVGQSFGKTLERGAPARDRGADGRRRRRRPRRARGAAHGVPRALRGDRRGGRRQPLSRRHRRGRGGGARRRDDGRDRGRRRLRALAPAARAGQRAHPRHAVGRPRRRRSSPPGERELFGYLAGQAGVSIENADLHDTVKRQAVTDELTGLFNHRRFQEVIANEVERTKRGGPGMGLIMLDIDNFKRVNDTYGHMQGDLVLREVARVLRETSREIDEPARYGGEEMAVALPGTDLDGAFLFAERVRRSIESLELPLIDGEGSLRVTASFGAAALPPDQEKADKDDLVAAADAALYRAKRSGKNRTVRAE